MKLSTRARYGLRILTELALHKEGFLASKNIAQSQQISIPYLQRIMAPLVAKGLVRSVRGIGGGVRLVEAPERIRLGEIVQLLEGGSFLVDCVNNPSACPRSNLCVTRDVWSEVERAIVDTLQAITLQDLVKRLKAKELLAVKSSLTEPCFIL